MLKVSYEKDESFSKNTKGYHDVAALATATICNHWNSVRILIKNETNPESADDDDDTPLKEPLFFHGDDSLALYSRPELIKHKSILTETLILHDVAIYEGLRTVEIIYATEFDRRDIECLNRHGKIAFQIAQARSVRLEGLVEAFQLMLNDTFALDARSPKQSGGVGNERNTVSQVNDDMDDLCAESFETLEDQCQDSAVGEGRRLQSAHETLLGNDSMTNLKQNSIDLVYIKQRACTVGVDPHSKQCNKWRLSYLAAETAYRQSPLYFTARLD